MTTTDGLTSEPLWLAIERKILELDTGDLSGDRLEGSVRRLASALDDTGLNVSRNAAHMLDLRGALGARATVGRPLMDDLRKALSSLTLEDVKDPYAATVTLIDQVGTEWPKLRDSERRAHVLMMVQEIKLELLVDRAKGMEGDGGIRMLIGAEVAAEVIMERLGIGRDDYDRVIAAVEAERAERARVTELLKSVSGKAESDRIRHLITSDVSDELITEMAEVDPGAIEAVRRAMEEEIAEKQRLAEEAAAKKAAAAVGPALEDIPPEEMLEHIESIREILDFSDVESEIRVMCEQSRIPKSLVDLAISEPDRLDELEAQAGG
jgi:hypothetical protein